MARLNSGGGLIARVSALEQSQDIAQTLSTNVSVFDATALQTPGSHSFVVAFTLPYRATLKKLRMRLQGNGSGGAGTQPARAVAYQGAGLADLPTGPLLGVSPAVTLSNPAPAGNYEWTFNSGVIGAQGVISAGVQFSLSGSVNQAMTIPVGSAPANSTLVNDDLYEDGTKTPFGSLTAGYSRLPLVELDIEPAPLDFTADIAALDTRLDTQEAAQLTNDSRLDALEDAPEGGAAATLTTYNATLAAADEYVTEAIDITGGGVAHGTAFATTAATVSIETLHGGSWRAGQLVTVPANRLTTVTAATEDDAVRLRFTQGASGADVELTIGLIG